MKVVRARKKRCIACKGKQASHKCYGMWHEKIDGEDQRYECSCPLCQPPVNGLRNMLKF